MEFLNELSRESVLELLADVNLAARRAEHWKLALESLLTMAHEHAPEAPSGIAAASSG
jgi:hypothetical protein